MISETSKVRYKVDRRRFLRSALIAGAVAVSEQPLRLRALAAGTMHFPAPGDVKRYFPTANEQRHFAPVKVARNRIIREVVGLRPYRSEGFVVEAERLGQKLLVHNYGHGGAGVTFVLGYGIAGGGYCKRLYSNKRREARSARGQSAPTGDKFRCAGMWRERVVNGPTAAAALPGCCGNNNYLCEEPPS